MVIVARPTRRKLPKRDDDPSAVIVHTTGGSDDDDDIHLEKIIAYYTKETGLQPHYLIGLNGTKYQFVDEMTIAYHAKNSNEAHLYQLGYAEWSRWKVTGGVPARVAGEYSGYLTWRKTWFDAQGIQSPLGLVTEGRPNGRAIGIEMQQPREVLPKRFYPIQYESAAELLVDIHARRPAITLDRSRVFGHYDVSPMTRCTASGGYDPGEMFDWVGLWDLVTRKAC